MTLELTQPKTHDPSKTPKVDDHDQKSEADAEHDHPHVDRLWSSTGAAPASAAPATPAADRVHTQWYVEYEAVAGKRSRSPARTPEDQLVVDELKIVPNGSSSTILTGGNMAKDGAVLLGSADLQKGPGRVSATVGYPTKNKFQVLVNMKGGKQGDQKEASKFAGQLVQAQLEDRGDYDALAADVQAQLADLYPGTVITVQIRPEGDNKTRRFSVAGADYAADSDSKFSVMIDPGADHQREVHWTRSESSEDGSASSDQSGVKTTTNVAAKKRQATKEKIVDSFKKSLTTGVQKVFENIEEQLFSRTGQHQTTYEQSVKWTVAIDPAKGDKPDDAKDKSGETGLFDKLKHVVTKAGSWVLSKGKGLAKHIPIVSAALELTGSLWDTITGRGSVKRESSSGDGGSDTTGTSLSGKTGKKINTLKSVAKELSETYSKEVQHDVETEIATSLETEVSSSNKTDQSKKTSVNKSVSGTTIIHDVDAPRLRIKKLG